MEKQLLNHKGDSVHGDRIYSFLVHRQTFHHRLWHLRPPLKFKETKLTYPKNLISREESKHQRKFEEIIK